MHTRCWVPVIVVVHGKEGEQSTASKSLTSEESILVVFMLTEGSKRAFLLRFSGSMMHSGRA